MKQKCIDIRPFLYAYVDNELTDEQCSIVTSHISECVGCRAQLSSIYKVHDMIKSVYVPKDEIDLSKKIMANIKFNNKYAKKHNINTNGNIETKIIKNKKSLPKIVASKLLYIAIVAAAIVVVIGATVTYFEKKYSPVQVEVADKTYDKFDDYVIEHYTNSYTGPQAQTSVISVNFKE